MEGCLPAAEKKLVEDPGAGLLTGMTHDVDPTVLYGDPALYENPANYGRFVGDMLACGLAELRPGNLGATVKVFFVKKSDGRLRVVIDCRGVNAICAEPPKTRLGSVQSITRSASRTGRPSTPPRMTCRTSSTASSSLCGSVISSGWTPSI